MSSSLPLLTISPQSPSSDPSSLSPPATVAGLNYFHPNPLQRLDQDPTVESRSSVTLNGSLPSTLHLADTLHSIKHSRESCLSISSTENEPCPVSIQTMPQFETASSAERRLAFQTTRGYSKSGSEIHTSSFSSSSKDLPTDLSKPAHRYTRSLLSIPYNISSDSSKERTQRQGGELLELAKMSPQRRSSMQRGQAPPLKDSIRKDGDNRIIFINNPAQSNEKYEYSGNKVRTSKYSMATFLPRNLFEQFHRMAYIYFLVIALLNQIPQLAVFGRTASLFPLLFVLTVTAIKDGYEDWRRHRSDKKENNRLALVMQGNEYKPKKWKRIEVGEMVKLHANEAIPCDMVLLATSDENGVAYVQTTNLDGETNLKTRYAWQETADRHPELNPISGIVVCQKPGRNIYDFSAYMEFEDRQLILSQTNIILRGCELKNTAWAVGVVVYAGQDTKAMLNSSGAQTKRSRLEQNMNRETLWLSFFLVVICLVGGIGTGIWVHNYQKYLDIIPFYRKLYLQLGDDYLYYGVFGEAFFAFLSFVIMFQIMIPISLYISMEVVRVGQSFFMIRDSEMFDCASNSHFQCRALNINEDLGQIKYIFSDKTGTLTENKMEFRNASVFGISYKDAKPVPGVESKIELTEQSKVINVSEGYQGWKPKTGAVVDLKLVEILQGPDTPERRAVHDYFLTLAACNTVVPTKCKPRTEMVDLVDEDECETIVYQGESPDEQALVTAAAAYGYMLLERTSNQIAISILGETQKFQVVGVHEFDSTRKCMSVILECPDKKNIKVLVKGADSSVLNNIAHSSDPGTEDIQQVQLMFTTKTHLHLYSREGLRTLAIATRDLCPKEYEAWQRQYEKAVSSIGERRAAMLQEASLIVERDLTLVGATGIEDKLQDGVPEAIAALREAGMKVWVLTGDKQETAISIGFSSALLTPDMHQIIINEIDKDSCLEAIVNAKASFVTNVPDLMNNVAQNATQSPVSMPLNGGPDKQSMMKEPSLALIIDGSSLVHALHEDLEQELFDLATACKVVICCRVAPFQKAGIVSLVKKKTNDMTLAIGDGANDVSMIQMADVGIGISGQEGRQAVMASDFAMGQFKFLKRLLLVHGHWNYNRMAYMVLYNFYRNSVFVMMLFWYNFHTGFSPSSALTEWSLVFYSLLYTSVPTVVVGILDKDVSEKVLLEQPGLYGAGHREESYNKQLFWLTMLDTLLQSLVLFYVPFFAYWNSTIDIWSIGSVWTISVVVLVNLHLAMDIQCWTWVTHIALWGSIIATYVCLFLLDAISTVGDLILHYGVIFNMVHTAGYWMNIFLIVCLALVPRFFVKVVRECFWPSDIQIAREAEIIEERSHKVLQGPLMNGS